MKSVGAILTLLSLVAPILLLAPPAARAEGVDVAVVTGLSGSVGHGRSGGDIDGALAAFQQLAANDFVELGPDSSATLVFFSGRKETWEGPVKLQIMADGATPVGEGSGNTVDVRIAPDAAGQFEQLPKVMGTSRSAVTVVLAPVRLDLPKQRDCRYWTPLELTPSERAFLEDARATYQSMRRNAAPADQTAEAFWLSVLGQYDQFDAMIPLLDELRGMYPDNPVLESVREQAAHCGQLLRRGADA